MSPWSTVKHSRKQWKQQARQRGNHDRYRRQQLARVTPERDRATHALTEAQARLRQLEAPSQGLPVTNKVDLVFFALPLVLVARLGVRAIARVLSLLAFALGMTKAPCPQTIIHWVTRLAMVRSQSARMLQGVALRRAPFAHGFLWMIASSLALGSGKIVAVWALEARHHHLAHAAPSRQQVRCLAVSVAASWTGDTRADVLKRRIAVLGRPTAYRKDGGSDRHNAIDLVAAQGLASPSSDAISHAVATRRKRRSHAHPQCATFVAAWGRVSGTLTHTRLACLAPPTVHTTARCMPVHRLVTWADRVRTLSPAGGAKAGSTLARWRAGLDQFPACKAVIQQCRDAAVALLACQKRLTTQGRSHHTWAQCEPLLTTLPSRAVRRELTHSLHYPLQTATPRGLDHVGLPISSAPIASLCGLAKQHGMGESKDAGRMALRLPALCGLPTRQEAQQVLDVSVAEQKAITAQCPSLTQQRRAVLPNPDALESLSMDQASLQMERIPGAKNRSNDQAIITLSNSYQTAYGPEMPWQDVHYRPASAVS